MLNERFWSKVKKTDACWLWTAGLSANGYGAFWIDGTTRRAHRIAYEELVGPIPEGLTIDHVKDRGCTNKNCVNPDHLEAVPILENVRRAPNTNRDKTHCKAGHALDEANTYLQAGKYYSKPRRYCRQCRSDRAKSPEYKARQKLYDAKRNQ